MKTAHLSRTAVAQIAEVCHEANRVYCENNQDFSIKPWSEAPEWQKLSSIAGVDFRLSNPGLPPSAQHEAWMADKLANGWVYGTEKDPENKVHPCIVPYEQLPEFQRKKDSLFQAIVDALK